MNVNASNDNSFVCSEKNEKLISKTPIKGTPFQAVKFGEEKTFLAWGKYRLPIETNTAEEMEIEVEANKWEITFMIAGIIAENIVEQSKN